MEVNSGIVPTIIANLMLNLAPNLVYFSGSFKKSTKKLKEEKKIKIIVYPV